MVSQLENVNLTLLQDLEFYKASFELSSSGKIVIENGTITRCNKKASELIGLPIDSILGSKIEKFIPTILQISTILQFENPHNSIEQETYLKKKGMEECNIPILITYRKLRIGKPIILVTLHDISNIKQAEDEIHLKTIALESASAGILLTDNQGNIQWANPKFEEISGYSLSEVLGQKTSFLKSGHHTDEFYSQLWNTITGGKKWTGEIINKHKDGTIYKEFMVITPRITSDGIITNFVAVKHQVLDYYR